MFGGFSILMMCTDQMCNKPFYISCYSGCPDKTILVYRTFTMRRLPGIFINASLSVCFKCGWSKLYTRLSHSDIKVLSRVRFLYERRNELLFLEIMYLGRFFFVSYGKKYGIASINKWSLTSLPLFAQCDIWTSLISTEIGRLTSVYLRKWCES